VPSREPELRAELTAMQRFHVLDCLSFGPWRATGPNGEPGGPRRVEDHELEGHWRSWASGEREWGRRDWAYWRFVRGWDAVTAFRRAQWPRQLEDRALELERIREYEIADWHNYWGDVPLEERRRVIRKAGRPEQIDPATCERFGVR
jgi:hypothetical protein